MQGQGGDEMNALEFGLNNRLAVEKAKKKIELILLNIY